MIIKAFLMGMAIAILFGLTAAVFYKKGINDTIETLDGLLGEKLDRFDIPKDFGKEDK